MISRRIRRALLGALVLAGCRATTGRPAFDAFPEAEVRELGFGLVDKVLTVERLTDTLAVYLQADSIPVRTVKPFDGFIESAWFDTASRTPRGRGIGQDEVLVRAWVSPSKPGFARVEIETVYRPLVDPSLPAREEERPVPPGHPVNRQMAGILDRLAKLYGVEDDSAATRPAAPGGPPIPVPAAPGSGAKVAAPDAEKPAAPEPGVRPAPEPGAKPAPADTGAKPATPDAARPPPIPPDTAVKPPADTAARTPAQPEAPPPPPPPAAPPADTAAPVLSRATRGYWVQAAAFETAASAADTRAALTELGFESILQLEDQLYKVRAGPFRTRSAANTALGRIRTALKVQAFLVVIR
ncbi:MAG: SPOR domain-containing protein [Gemmatimonadales bacterium]